MPYSTTFTNTSTVVVPGTTHALGTANLVHEVYDSTGTVMQAGSVHVDPVTYTVTLLLSVASSGRLVLIEATPFTAVGGPVPGSPTATSYVSVQDATTFLYGRLYTEPWLEADTTTQEQALVWATQLIDEQMLWYGVPTTLTQALAWPQTGQTDPLGRPVPSDSVPAAIQRATAFYALALLRAQAAATEAHLASTIKSRRVGDTEITYHDPPDAATLTPVTTAMPAEVQAILRPYGVLAGPMTVHETLKRATFHVD